MDDRIATGLWVEAKLRELDQKAIAYYIINKGAYFSGAVLLKINNLSGICRVLTQETHETGKKSWVSPLLKDELSESDAEAYAQRARIRDPDLWIIEIEERNLMNPFEENKSKGFTLVELSIVMIIIGLLIGGVLKGQELMENARIKRMVSDLRNMEAASQTFYDIYQAMAGDIALATRMIPNCGATNFCRNGNGNGYVASDGTDQYANHSPIVRNAPDWMESVQYWKHLALAGMINGINGSADTASLAYGSTHPQIPGGGLEFYFDANMLFQLTGDYTGSHVLRTSSESSLRGEVIDRILTPTFASKVDVIMDDGAPNSGIVVANYGATADNTCKSSVGGSIKYNVETSKKNMFAVFPSI